MRDNWRRISNTIRWVAVLIILVVIGMAAYQVYDFYRDRVGTTAEKAVQAYFSALAAGNYEEVYRLTAKDNLTDIYGRPITKDEFIEQLRRLTGGRQLPLRVGQMVKLAEHKGARVYAVTLQSDMGGASGQSRLLVEVRRAGNGWVILYPFGIFL